MVRLSWEGTSAKFFETGVDQGVLYVAGQDGVPWIGLTSVSENPSGGDARETFLDGIKIVNRSKPEDFKAQLEAYTYPREFEACEGSHELANGLRVSQQNRKMFNLSYRTKVGNDTDGVDHAYKIHLVYNALAAPTSKDYESLSDDTEPAVFSWDISTRPERFEDPFFGVRYGAHLVLDSRVVYPWAMEAVLNVLYGTEETPPTMPTPQELIDLFVDNALLQVTDNGDGTWTAVGPDEAITLIPGVDALVEDVADPGTYLIQGGSLVEDVADPGTYTFGLNLMPDPMDNGTYLIKSIDQFTINWASAVMIDEDTYNLSSL